MTGVYRVGRASLVITLAAVIYLLALVDIYVAARRLRPLGSRLQTWSARYPVLSRGLILFWCVAGPSLPEHRGRDLVRHKCGSGYDIVV